MPSRHQRFFAVVVGVVTILGGVPASAQAPVPDAKELSAGDAAARSKAWDQALAHYQAALAAAPGLRAQLGAADALYHLGRLGEAYEAYDDAQRTYAGKLGADAATVSTRLKEIATKTGWLSIRLTEPGAAVELDAKALGTSPVPALVRVAVGSHVVKATKAGFVPFETRAEVTPDGKAIVDVTLSREATEGHVVVQAGTEPLRVLVDGVDVGAAPWEGDLPPGTHEITGRSSTASAQAQTVTLSAGSKVTVDLVATPTAGHLQIRTSDGQGLITVDGAVRGTGAFAGDLAPGEHTVAVTRDGYQPYQKTLALGVRESAAETVTLQPIAAVAPTGKAGAAPEGEGLYGGFGLGWAPEVGGMGTELELNCSTLGAASCDTPAPTASASVFGYVGWTWNPVGFELLLAAASDVTDQSATFNAKGGNSGTLPATAPARIEKFTFARFGGFAALRVRASYSTKWVRATVAGGLGVSYRAMLMKRDAMATDGSGLRNLYIPDPVEYFSPGVSLEGAVHVRLTPTVALAIGAEMWAENASLGGSNASPPSTGHFMASTTPGVTPLPIPTPQYHFATGSQIFLGPFLGMQFGP